MQLTKILTFVLLPILLPLAIFFSTWFITEDWAKKDDCCIAKHITENIPNAESWNFESKVKYFSKTAGHVAVLTLLSVVLCLVGRLTGNTPNPHRNKKNIYLQGLVNLVSHNVQDAFVFLPLFFYWTLKFTTEKDVTDVAVIASLYFVARVIFNLGHLITTFTNLPIIRIPGFVIGLFTQILLVSKVVGHDVAPFFVEHFNVRNYM